MRRLPLIIGLALITGLTVRDLYEFFVTDDGIHYFSSEPRRLLYVMVLGATGGLVALWISRMSSGSQRKLKLAALGGFGTLLVGALVSFAYLLCSLGASGFMAALKWAWIAALIAVVPMMVVTVLVWLEFLEVWKQTR